MDFLKTQGKGPERLTVEMEDPIFPPSASKTATCPITVSPAGMACAAELFIGPHPTTKTATSGRINFTSTGSPQNVNLPISMPVQGGSSYHVYIDVYAGDLLFLSYIATEDVLIPGGSIGPITWG
jgi:hypothetical protein